MTECVKTNNAAVRLCGICRCVFVWECTVLDAA